MLASDSGHTDVVQLLLSSGAQVDLQDKVRHIVNLLIVHKMMAVPGKCLSTQLQCSLSYYLMLYIVSNHLHDS